MNIYFSFLGEGKFVENETEPKVDFFTLQKNKEQQEFNNNELSEKSKQSFFLNKIHSKGNLENDDKYHMDKINVSKLKKSIQDFKRNKIELGDIRRMLKIIKEKVKEISDDRNQVIADKINLENNYDSLAIKFNKLHYKNRDYFTTKDKISGNMKIDNAIYTSNSSKIKPCLGIVNTEKNLDEMIFELENKFSFIKIENGILTEKIDNVDELIVVDDIKNKVILLFFIK